MKVSTVIALSYTIVWLFFSDFFCFHFCKCFFDVLLVVDSLHPYDKVHGMHFQLLYHLDKVKDLLFWTELSVGNINDVNEKEVMNMCALVFHLYSRWLVLVGCVKITMTRYCMYLYILLLWTFLWFKQQNPRNIGILYINKSTIRNERDFFLFLFY